MLRPCQRLTLVGLALLAAPLTGAAQKLQPGTWTGTITPPGAGAMPVTYDVRVSGDTTNITMKAQFGELPLLEIKVLADRVTFSFSPGPTVRCTLMLREDKSYTGSCIDSDGDSGQLVMIPPSKSGSAEASPLRLE